MNDYLKIKQLLGLCLKAGKLITGENLVLDAIRKGKAKYVFVANDTGKATKKKILDKSKYYNVPVSLVLSSNDLVEALGKPRKIIAISEQGFAKKIQELLNEKG